MAYGRKRVSRKRVSRRSRTTPFKKAPVKRLVRNYKTKQLVKLIKGVQLKQSETCYKSLAISTSNHFHDLIKLVPIWDSFIGNPPLFPSQGSTDGERRGDEILTNGIMYRGVFQIPYDRRNTVFKMWFLQYNSAQGDPSVYSNFFHNVSGDGMLDPIQTDRWRGIRYLGKFRCRSVDQATTEGSDKTVHIKRWLPLKKKVTFINDGSSTPSNLREHGVLVIVPYDTITTAITDIVITRAEHCFTLYYKDP